MAMISLQLNYIGEYLTLRATPSAEFLDRETAEDSTETLQLAAMWQDKDLLVGDLRFDGSVEVGSGIDQLSGGVDYKNRYGRISVGINHLLGAEESVTS